MQKVKMTRKKLFIPVLTAILGAVPAMGQDAFDQTIDLIVTSNPQVQSERGLAKAVALDNADANSLANPEVSFSRVWGTKGVGNKLQLDVTQSFDWPGLYGARRKANSRQQNAAAMLCRWTELQVSLEAKRLLIELVYVRNQIALYRELMLNMEQLEQAVNSAHKQGYASDLDRRKIAIEKYKIAGQSTALDARRVQIEGELQALCYGATLNLEEIDAYPIEPILSLEEYQAQIISLDPQIAASVMTEDAEAFGAKAATLERYPGFSVGYQHQAELGDRFNGFTVGMTLPFFENRHGRTAAIARADVARSLTYALQAEKQATVVSSMTEMSAWREQVETYLTVFGDNAYLTLIKKAYLGGELSVLEYLTEIRYFSEATQAYYEAEYNYHLTLAELNKYNLIKKQ